MRPLKLLVLFVGFSLASCGGKGPKVTVCLINVAELSLECGDADGKQSTKMLHEADNYVCLSPSDAQKVVDYVKVSCK